MPLPADDDRVLLLRVRAAGLDPSRARLRAARLLSAATLRPRGLPPEAILIVRRLVDPLPGGFGLRRDALRPADTWEPVSYTHLTLPTILLV